MVFGLHTVIAEFRRGSANAVRTFGSGSEASIQCGVEGVNRSAGIVHSFFFMAEAFFPVDGLAMRSECGDKRLRHPDEAK